MIPDSSKAISILYDRPIHYFNSRYPIDSDTENYKWLQLTSDAEWNPQALNYKNYTQEIFVISEVESFMYDKAAKSIIISFLNVKSSQVDY